MKHVKLWTAIGIIGVAGSAIAAVPFIPGTQYHSQRLAKSVVSGMLSDPSSAQFKELKTGDDKIGRNNIVCGEVNGRNKIGGYAGYRRFAYEVASNAAFIDPESKYTEQDSVTADKFCGEEAFTSRCSRAREIDDEVVSQVAFNGGWDAACAALYRKS